MFCARQLQIKQEKKCYVIEFCMFYFYETTFKTIDKLLHDLLLIIIKDDRSPLYCRMLYTCKNITMYYILLCYALLPR
jgi:hypothetical protein